MNIDWNALGQGQVAQAAPPQQAQQQSGFGTAMNGLFGQQMLPFWASLAFGGTKQDQGRLATQALAQGNQLTAEQQQFAQKQALAREELSALERYRNSQLGVERSRMAAAQAYRDQALGLDREKFEFTSSRPLTELGQLQADLTAGRISQDQYDMVVGGLEAETLPPVPANYMRVRDEAGRPTIAVTPIPGGPAAGMNGEIAARMATMQVARRSFNDVEDYYLGEGGDGEGAGYNNVVGRARDVSLAGYRPFAGGESGRARRNVQMAVEGALRALTGAAAPEPEVQRYVDMYAPEATDGPETRRQKLTLLKGFMDQIDHNIRSGNTNIPTVVLGNQGGSGSGTASGSGSPRIRTYDPNTRGLQ